MAWETRPTGERGYVNTESDKFRAAVETGPWTQVPDDQHVWFANIAFWMSVEDVRASFATDEEEGAAPVMSADNMVSIKVMCGRCGLTPEIEDGGDPLYLNEPCPGAPR